MTKDKITVSIDATHNPAVKAGQKVWRGEPLCESFQGENPPTCPISGVVDRVRFEPENHTFVISISPAAER